MAAVSRMSWLVAPWCTAGRGDAGDLRRSAPGPAAGTGLPVQRRLRAELRGVEPVRAGRRVTAAPAPGGASPARSSARASAASASSMACSQAASPAATPPRPKRAENRPVT